jgi:hypothetical protein
MLKQFPKLVAVGALAVASPVRGQVLLNYSFSYVTSGGLSCNIHYASYCSVSGNTLTLTNGGGALTFTFTGSSGDATVERGVADPFTIGTLSASLTGPDPFLFPFDPFVGAAPIFMLGVAIEETGPVSGNGGWVWWAFPMGTEQPTATLARVSTDWTRLPIPSGFVRSDLLASTDVDSYMIQGNGASVDITGHFNIVPEPGTVVLVATGLGALAIGGLRARRRR